MKYTEELKLIEAKIEYKREEEELEHMMRLAQALILLKELNEGK